MSFGLVFSSLLSVSIRSSMDRAALAGLSSCNGITDESVTLDARDVFAKNHDLLSRMLVDCSHLLKVSLAFPSTSSN